MLRGLRDYDFLVNRSNVLMIGRSSAHCVPFHCSLF